MMEHEHDTHHVNYLYIFIMLCVFTLMSVVFDGLGIKGKTMFGKEGGGTALLAVLVLAVAVAKALCVMLFFMHLKFERNWKYVILAPTTILAIGLPLALLPDIGVHYYTLDVPQVHDSVDHAASDHPDAEDDSKEGH